MNELPLTAPSIPIPIVFVVQIVTFASFLWMDLMTSCQKRKKGTSLNRKRNWEDTLNKTDTQGKKGKVCKRIKLGYCHKNLLGCNLTLGHTIGTKDVNGDNNQWQERGDHLEFSSGLTFAILLSTKKKADIETLLTRINILMERSRMEIAHGSKPLHSQEPLQFSRALCSGSRGDSPCQANC